MSDKVSRLLLPVSHLAVTRVWDVGRVRFHPAGSASTLLAEARTSARTVGPAWYEQIVNDKGAEFDGSTLAEVTAAGIDEALALVTDALAVLRVVQRLQHPMVDNRVQTFGLPGQVTTARVDYLNLTDAPTTGWRRLGDVPGWTFTDADHYAWSNDAVFRFLNDALAQPKDNRTFLQRRVLVAVDLFNQAWRSSQPDVALLNCAMAIEVLLGEPGDTEKKFRLARRVSYFVCGWPDRRYQDRKRAACPYLALRLDNNGRPEPSLRQLVRNVGTGAEPHMYCSQFFDIIDLYNARNAIVHGGRIGLTDRQEEQATWYLASWLLRPALTWFAEHPGAELTELDMEIASLPAAATSRLSLA